jgi:hypothetical protein
MNPIVPKLISEFLIDPTNVFWYHHAIGITPGEVQFD